MKIRIVQAPCIGLVHGVTVGKEFLTLNVGKFGTWIKGDNGEDVRLFDHEFDIVDESVPEVMSESFEINSRSMHDWRKVNLVSLKDGSDDYICAKCGIKANRRLVQPDYFNIRHYRYFNKKYLNCETSLAYMKKRYLNLLISNLSRIGISFKG